MAVVLLNLKALPQWHSYSSKATPLDPLQTATIWGPTIQMPKTYGGHLIQMTTAFMWLLGTEPRPSEFVT